MAGIAALALAAPGLAGTPSPAPLTVFAAASLKEALDEVGKAFTAGGGAPVRFSYGASSVVARQIDEGAPADIFISADSAWMDWLANRAMIFGRTRRNLLSNHLALIAPSDSQVSLKIAKGMPIAAALNGGRLAMAGPEVPAGRYGEAALTSLGVWDQVEDHLARTENVRAALAFVARAETPLGIVYDTDAKVEPKVRIVGLFPDASHPPIVYPAAKVATSKYPEADAFLAFLAGPKAGAIFRHYGFITLNH